MNKKIKAIDLASIVYQRKDIPKKVKYNSTEYKYSEEFCDYENQLGNYLFSIITLRAYWMNEEIEILEEEIGISKLEKEKALEENPANFRYDLKYYYDKEKMGDKINEIIAKVNKLDKKINKE